MWVATTNRNVRIHIGFTSLTGIRVLSRNETADASKISRSIIHTLTVIFTRVGLACVNFFFARLSGKSVVTVLAAKVTEIH